jgi:hypothetical protein
MDLLFEGRKVLHLLTERGHPIPFFTFEGRTVFEKEGQNTENHTAKDADDYQNESTPIGQATMIHNDP